MEPLDPGKGLVLHLRQRLNDVGPRLHRTSGGVEAGRSTPASGVEAGTQVHHAQAELEQDDAGLDHEWIIHDHLSCRPLNAGFGIWHGGENGRRARS